MFNMYRWKGKPYHVAIFVDPKTNHFYLTKEKMFSTIYVSGNIAIEINFMWIITRCRNWLITMNKIRWLLLIQMLLPNWSVPITWSNRQLKVHLKVPGQFHPRHILLMSTHAHCQKRLQSPAMMWVTSYISYYEICMHASIVVLWVTYILKFHTVAYSEINGHSSIISKHFWL